MNLAGLNGGGPRREKSGRIGKVIPMYLGKKSIRCVRRLGSGRRNFAADTCPIRIISLGLILIEPKIAITMNYARSIVRRYR
jgi:hypothetical protein